MTTKYTGRFSRLDNTQFTGTRTCQCSRCHEVFGSETGFTMHRANGSRKNGTWLGDCRNPAEFGMNLHNGVWKIAGTRPAESSAEVPSHGSSSATTPPMAIPDPEREAA